jgi:hypothetical protein
VLYFPNRAVIPLTPTYNVLFKATSGEKSKAQIEPFEDTWHWNDSAEAAFDELMSSGSK